MHQRTPETRMSTPKGHRWSLSLAAGILLAVGLPIFADPLGYQAQLGVVLPHEATLLSDMRAQAGALLGMALLMLAGAWLRPHLARGAALAGAVFYLSYGLARLVSMVADGLPAPTLSAAAGLELLVGALLATIAYRSRPLSTRERGRPGAG